MKKLAVLVVLAMVLAFVPAMAQEKEPSTVTTAKDWGNLITGNNAAVVNVKGSLTSGKEGLSPFFTTGDFGKITKSATAEAKKLFTQLYAINGISNMRYSTYQIILNKADLYDWAEIESGLFAAMDSWHEGVNKQPAEKTE